MSQKVKDFDETIIVYNELTHYLEQLSKTCFEECVQHEKL